MVNRLLLINFLFFTVCCCKDAPKNRRLKKEIATVSKKNELVFIGKNNLSFAFTKISQGQASINSWNFKFNDTLNEELLNITNDSLWNYTFDKLTKLKYKQACNPKLYFDGKTFSFKSHEDGNEINWEKLKNLVLSQLNQPFKTISLLNNGVYKTSEFKVDDKVCSEIISIAEKRSKLKFTFIDNNVKYELTGTDLSKILTTNEEMKLQIDDSRLYSYLNSLAKKVDRIQSPISFIDASNTSRVISNSELGHRLNIQAMMKEVNKNFNANSSFEKEVIYLLKGVPSISLTSNRNYIEVNITEQKIFFFKNDSIVLSSDIVTGKNGMSTPKGAFFIKYKETNTYLDGPGYHCYVRYFMPIFNGIGLHDASWRSNFGGNIYAASGSHGCINLPPPVAAFAYNNYPVGAVVICH